MTMQSSSKYLFAYITQRSKWERALATAVIRGMAVLLCGFILLMEIDVGITGRLTRAYGDCGSFIVMLIYALFIVSAFTIYKPEFFFSDSTPLIVCISQKEVFIRVRC